MTFQRNEVKIKNLHFFSWYNLVTYMTLKTCIDNNSVLTNRAFHILIVNPEVIKPATMRTNLKLKFIKYILPVSIKGLKILKTVTIIVAPTFLDFAVSSLKNGSTISAFKIKPRHLWWITNFNNFNHNYDINRLFFLF